MTDILKCPVCNDTLVFDEVSKNYCHKHGITKECPHSAYLAHPMIWKSIKQLQDALNYALKVLQGVDEIGGIDLEIVKIKKMAGITTGKDE